MALDFGTFNLGSIDPNTSVIANSEFYTGADGKTIIAKSGYFNLANETVTLHTVTSGKVLYVKQLFFKTGSLSAGSGHVKFGDNVSDALSVDTIYNAVILYLTPGDNIAPTYIFPIPLAITTAFMAQTDSTISETLIGFIGWEENVSNAAN